MDWPTAGIIGTIILATLGAGRLIGGGTWTMASRITSIESNLVGVQLEMKRLGDVLVKIADMRGELRVLDTRMTSAEQDVRDLQRGEGYVLPLQRGAHEHP